MRSSRSRARASRGPKTSRASRSPTPLNSAIPRLFEAYAQAAGTDSAQVDWSVVSSGAIASTLVLGRADAVGYYSLSEAILGKATGGQELVQLRYSDAGLDFYSNGIIASERILDENLDVVRRFSEATWRGVRDAIANPQEAAAIMNRHHSQIDMDVAEGEIIAVGGLLSEDQSGVIDIDRMRQTVDVVSGAYDLQNPVTATDVFVAGMSGTE